MKHQLIILLLLLPLHIRAEEYVEKQFIWSEAKFQMASARKPEDFLRAAATLNKLVNAGVKNAPLFYNIGTLLLKAGYYDEAVVYLLRSERYSGTTWEIERNLCLAAAAGDENTPLTPAWYRYPLFWHFGLSMKTRLLINLFAFTILWIPLCLRAAGIRRPVSTPIIALSLTILIVFGSSLLTSLHQEYTATVIDISQLLNIDGQQKDPGQNQL